MSKIFKSLFTRCICFFLQVFFQMTTEPEMPGSSSISLALDHRLQVWSSNASGLYLKFRKHNFHSQTPPWDWGRESFRFHILPGLPWPHPPVDFFWGHFLNQPHKDLSIPGPASSGTDLNRYVKISWESQDVQESKRKPQSSRSHKEAWAESLRTRRVSDLKGEDRRRSHTGDKTERWSQYLARAQGRELLNSRKMTGHTIGPKFCWATRIPACPKITSCFLWGLAVQLQRCLPVSLLLCASFQWIPLPSNPNISLFFDNWRSLRNPHYKQ